MMLHTRIDGEMPAAAASPSTRPMEPPEPIVVFLGSLGSTSAMWEPQIDALSPLATCIRLDWRGHGESPSVPGPYSLAGLGADVIDTLDAFGIGRAHVVGLSLGAMVAMWIAEQYPDRVDRLALLCTSAALGPSTAWTERAELVRSEGMEAVASAVVRRWFTEDYATARPDEIETFVDMVRSTDPAGYAGCCEAIATMDVAERLTSIRAATLVIAGRDDPATPPEHGERIAAVVPHAALAVVAGAHLASWESAAVVNDLLCGHLHLASGRGAEPASGALETGMAIRRQVLGEEYVDRATQRTTPLTRPFQEYITATAWGQVWSRDGLDHHTRRRLTIALLAALRAEHELGLHIDAALRDGVKPTEIAEVIMHTGVYAGIPAANSAMSVLQAVVEARGVAE